MLLRSDKTLVEADDSIVEILGKMDFLPIPSSNIRLEVGKPVSGSDLRNIGIRMCIDLKNIVFHYHDKKGM